MKADINTVINKKVFKVDEDHENINKYVKAVIINLKGKDIIVKNDNFGTKRKYADFTNGKKEAGLHPLQIVFSGVDFAKIRHDRYINAEGEICQW